MRQEKESLYLSNRRYYIWQIFKNGLRKATSGKPTIVFVALLVGIVFALDYWERISPPYVKGLVGTVSVCIFPLLVCLLILAFGYTRRSYDYYCNCIRSGLTNLNGEPPVLISITQDGKIIQLEFLARGLPYYQWADKLAEIENALNVSISLIKQGSDKQRVIVRCVDGSEKFDDLILFNDTHVNYEDDADFALGRTLTDEVHINLLKQPMILFGGSTGSGKSNLALIVAYQAAMRGNVIIYDPKGVDYQCLARHDVRIVDNPDDLLSQLTMLDEEIQRRKQSFLKNDVTDIVAYREKTRHTMKRWMIIIDEASELLDGTGLSKEEKERTKVIIRKLSNIFSRGRFVGITGLIATQIPDAETIPMHIKRNCDVRIAGKCDEYLSEMILGSRVANDLVPKDSQGLFVLKSGDSPILFKSFYYDRNL